MKHLLIALAVVTLSISCLRTISAAESAQRGSLQGAAAVAGQRFQVPYGSRPIDPMSVIGTLEEVAQKTHVNLFRTISGFDGDRNSVTTHAMYLTGDTAITQDLQLDSGRMLTPEETRQHGSQNVSTPKGGDADTVGLLRDIGDNDRVSIRPFAWIASNVPISGSYVVEVPNGGSAQPFMRMLAEELTKVGHSTVTEQGLAANPPPSVTGAGSAASIAALAYWMLLISTTLLAAYELLRASKREAILRLHGFGPLGVWHRVLGRALLLTVAVSLAVGTVASLAVPDSDLTVVSATAWNLGIASALILAGSLIASLYLNRESISSALKNQKHTRVLFVTNVLLKTMSSAALIVFASGLVLQYDIANEARASLGDWRHAADYGVFYPTSVGLDGAEMSSGLLGPTAAESGPLYDTLDSQGALYVDASAYSEANLANPLPAGSFRSLVVNPNYLTAFPLLDDSGVAIHVADEDPEWTLLVPVSLRSRESEVRDFFVTARKAAQAASAKIFGVSSPAGSVVHIIWMREDQSAFTLNPLAAPKDGNVVRDPIIQVMTTHNSLPIDRANGVSGGIDSALKVKLLDGSPSSTIKALDPLLEKLRLEDNLTSLVSLADYRGMEIARLDEGIRSVVSVLIVVLAVLSLLALQNVSLLFDRNRRRIVIMKFQGHGFIRRESSYCLWLYASWAVGLGLAVMANSAGVSLFSTTTAPLIAPLGVVMTVGLVALAFEATIGYVRLLRLEASRMTTTLKEDF